MKVRGCGLETGAGWICGVRREREEDHDALVCF
jgi:hypothetical protein